MELAIVNQNQATDLQLKNAELEKKIIEERELKTKEIQQIEESHKAQVDNMNIERINFIDDMIIETELKELIIKKKELHIQRLKTQLYQLIKLSRYPRLIKEMWDKFKEEKNLLIQ